MEMILNNTKTLASSRQITPKERLGKMAPTTNLLRNSTSMGTLNNQN